MFCLNDTMRYYLCPGRTDMRKGISSLCGVVHEKMGCEARNGDVFIFIGSSRRLMKLLHAEDGGMVMYVKRLCDEANLSADERKTKCNELARPIMEAMKLWMETEGIKYSESSQIGKAITYAYTRWDNMMHYLDDGRLLLDNNLAENEIRPITLGRKNYLFCGNHEAAMNMCIVNSLLATCRNHDVNPRLYLNDIISQMPYMTKETHEELVELLPHKWKALHPEAIMTKLRDEL